MKTIMIPNEEYAQRVEKATGLIADAGLDVMVANSNEADYANVRYFSAYWPLFEMGGVAIAPSGQSGLMIGLESEEYARGRSVMGNIHLMAEYRETADPEYPGMAADSYADTFESIGVKNPKRIGLAGYLCTNMAMYEGLKKCFPDAEIVNADNIMTQLRSIKSPAEIACLIPTLFPSAKSRFRSLTISSTPGIRSLGYVAILGVLGALISSLVVLPAVLRVIEGRRR